MPASRTSRLQSAGVAVAVLGADQLTKAWAVDRLSRGPIHVAWTLDLALAHNTGTAFSLLSGRGVGPVIALVAVAVVASLALNSRMFRTTVGSIAIGLVLGGAIGNLADRAFRSHHGFMQGAVVDFVDLGWWPVFNVADACIVIGVAIIAVLTAFTGVGSGAPETGDR